MAAILTIESLSDSSSGTITSMDVVMVLAKELMTGLDKAFEKEPDPKQNEIMYTNQKVSSSAALLMVMMGWVKL